jgi:hypothetical protein
VPSLAVPTPAAHGPVGEVLVDGHQVDPRVPKEPLDDVLSGRPEPRFDDHAQLDPDRGGHQPLGSFLQMACELLSPRLAEDHRNGG